MENIKKPLTSKGGGKAIASFILGIIGLITWRFPIIGAPVTITGLFLGIQGRNSIKKGLATAGIVLCIFGLLGTIIKALIFLIHNLLLPIAKVLF